MRLFAAALPLLAAAALSPAQAARPIEFATAAPRAGVIVLPLGSQAELASRGSGLDAGTREAIARAIDAAEFEYDENAVLTLRGVGPYSQIVIVGTGEDALDAGALREIGGVAARETASANGPVTLIASGLGQSVAGAASQLAIGAELGGYSFDRYKYVDPAKPRAAGRDAAFTIVTQDAPAAQGYRDSGRPLVEGVGLTRDLISEPANVLYPEIFVERARAAFEGVQGVTITVLDVPAMERLGMGAILSVGQGSIRPPRMMIVEYRGPGAQGAPIVLVGKGITFDTGGISIKPGAGMWRMKSDMSGAAAVIGTALSLAKSRAPVHIVVIAALAENMPGANATRPGDVVKAMNGKTIEILSTDAEGRMVLADGVAYAERQYRPAVIVDIATLTGAVVGALGSEYAGLLTRNDALADQLLAAGETSGDALWRLPLHPSYAEDIKSDIADVQNIAEGAAPGAGVGGHFIGYFVESTPWAHIDIAGTAWAAEGSPTVPKGAAGFGVRLLDRFVRDFRAVPAETGGAGD